MSRSQLSRASALFVAVTLGVVACSLDVGGTDMTGIKGVIVDQAPVVIDKAWHTMIVSVAGVIMIVSIDGTPKLTVTLPSVVSFSGHWGFSAATGGLHESHEITNVRMSIAGACL